MSRLIFNILELSFAIFCMVWLSYSLGKANKSTYDYKED